MIVGVAERARADFAEAVKPFGLPAHVARALFLLDQSKSMRTVASELSCDPSHVTGIADELETRGLAVRSPGTDRRIKMLELTAEGSALRENITAAVAAQAPFAAGLTPAQKQTLRDLLSKL
ncbi:hypothetical protein GCM10009648_00660 [Tsukamurella spumae]